MAWLCRVLLPVVLRQQLTEETGLLKVEELTAGELTASTITWTIFKTESRLLYEIGRWCSAIIPAGSPK